MWIELAENMGLLNLSEIVRLVLGADGDDCVLIFRYRSNETKSWAEFSSKKVRDNEYNRIKELLFNYPSVMINGKAS